MAPPTNPVALALALPGPVLLVVGVVHLLVEQRLRARRTRVTGEVVGWSDADHPNPTIAFTTLEGERVQATRTAFDIGFYPLTTVVVWYEPADPHRFSWQRRGLPAPGLTPLLLSLPLLWLTVQVLARG